MSPDVFMSASLQAITLQWGGEQTNCPFNRLRPNLWDCFQLLVWHPPPFGCGQRGKFMCFYRQFEMCDHAKINIYFLKLIPSLENA